jgi:hypothetical protein
VFQKPKLSQGDLEGLIYDHDVCIKGRRQSNEAIEESRGIISLHTPSGRRRGQDVPPKKKGERYKGSNPKAVAKFVVKYPKRENRESKV